LFKSFPTLDRGHGGCHGIWGVSIAAGLVFLRVFELALFDGPLLFINCCCRHFFWGRGVSSFDARNSIF